MTVRQSLFIAPCSHVFHYKCVRPLLQQYHPGFSCPICRTFANLEEDVEVELEEGVEVGGSVDDGDGDGDGSAVGGDGPNGGMGVIEGGTLLPGGVHAPAMTGSNVARSSSNNNSQAAAAADDMDVDASSGNERNSRNLSSADDVEREFAPPPRGGGVANASIRTAVGTLRGAGAGGVAYGNGMQVQGRGVDTVLEDSEERMHGHPSVRNRRQVQNQQQHQQQQYRTNANTTLLNPRARVDTLGRGYESDVHHPLPPLPGHASTSSPSSGRNVGGVTPSASNNAIVGYVTTTNGIVGAGPSLLRPMSAPGIRPGIAPTMVNNHNNTDRAHSDDMSDDLVDVDVDEHDLDVDLDNDMDLRNGVHHEHDVVVDGLHRDADIDGYVDGDALSEDRNHNHVRREYGRNVNVNGSGSGDEIDDMYGSAGRSVGGVPIGVVGDEEGGMGSSGEGFGVGVVALGAGAGVGTGAKRKR